jgi:hypothetical protein
VPAPLWRPHMSRFALLATCSLAVAAQGCSTLVQDGEGGLLDGRRLRVASALIPTVWSKSSGFVCMSGTGACRLSWRDRWAMGVRR